MRYIFINPVTASIYDAAELEAALLQNGYERISVQEDWHRMVKEKYKRLLQATHQTVLDQRCPKAIETVAPYVDDRACIPSIHPILIHCGIELSENPTLRGRQKIITTPCQSLADYGNRLALPETTFIPWNQFFRTLHLEKPLTLQTLGGSPIPPGYFHDLNAKITSLSGKETIESYFESGSYAHDALVEMLYCDNGCHNGDGVYVNE